MTDSKSQKRGLVSRIRVENLRYLDFGPFHFSIASFETVGLIGASGAGKTLLMRSIADLDPHEGDIFLDDTESRQMSGPEWRRNVGMLPTESRWWHTEVRPHFTEINEDWLSMLGFEPDVLGWEVDRLSGGERQRLALLRLLCNRPQVLLLDEPTANLDPANVERVEQLLSDYRFHYGPAMLWVSHDKKQIRRVASRYFRMKNGKLIELGNL